ncbi:MAG: hypothetical protein JW727_06335 [Candidatus Aenigmarchaeota archaeon]|nr:hypothetical protein [Candidatus Aenigmarchaeota archaeon]
MHCKDAFKVRVFCALVFCLILAPISFAESVHVYRDFPGEARIGSVIQINLTVENLGASVIEATIQENVGDYTVIEPTPVSYVGTPGIIGFRLPYFEWNVTVGPMQNETVYYRVNLTSPGEVLLSPATVIVGDEYIYSDSGSISVICNQNGDCESLLNENCFNCPEDCPTGASDGICDLVADGRCDPDCEEGSDEDCPYCGDGICSPKEDESTCPGDCRVDRPQDPEESGDTESPGSEGMDYGLILGIVFALAILILIAVYLKRRASKTSEIPPEAPAQSQPIYPEYPQ